VSRTTVISPEDEVTIAAPPDQQQPREQREPVAKPKGKSDLASALAFLSPTLLVLSAFVFFPVVFSFYLSFHTWNMFSSSATFVGLGNYSAIVKNPEFWSVLKNTAYYTLGTVPLNMVISLGIAFFLNKKLAGKKFLRTAFFAPVIMSSVAAAVIWRWVYEPSFGLLNYVLSWFGIPAVNWLNNPTSAMFALIAMGVWKSFGFNMVLFSAGLQGIPDHYYEAAQIDGAGKLRQFWNITIPLLSPTTFFVLIMSVIGSFQVFDTVYVLTSGGPLGSTKVLVFYLYEQAFKFFDMGYASAVAYLLFAVVFILTMLQMKYLRGSVHYTS
jgi:multiple sugar transport system permease protein